VTVVDDVCGGALVVERNRRQVGLDQTPQVQGALVGIDPYTGEVYAEATYPSYDANDYRTIATQAPQRFIDPVVSNVYEPGSVFKMMTSAAALEDGVVMFRKRGKGDVTVWIDPKPQGAQYEEAANA